ncbi:hypothetical protein [Taklimakanibacter deserti]|uniref:hypothetical protein n=1 Tax=Taklimakanibacter deserti TaxID=2267839 RepID=UPI000E64B1BC
MPNVERPFPLPVGADTVASDILARADRDIAFVPRLTGESQHLLVRHFIQFIERELVQCDMGYDSYPLLRGFVETHARELSDFVVGGLGLTHQLGLQTVERMAGDPMHLLRADIWDTLRDYIANAEDHFVSDVGGLRKLIADAESARRDAARASSQCAPGGMP